LETYCFKCKQKREMNDPIAIFSSNGAPATSGLCEVCGTKMYKVGRTPAHEGLTPPPQLQRPVHKKNTNTKSPVRSRKGKMVIVESPAKAKTVGNFLGKDYVVRASVGHVRDLLRSQLSVDVENNFEPRYRVPNEKRAVVKELKADANRAEEIFLATDPDREGEAIAQARREGTLRPSWSAEDSKVEGTDRLQTAS